MEILALLFLAGAFLFFIAAVVGAIKPNLVRQESRAKAFGLSMMLSCALVVAFVLVLPTPTLSEDVHLNADVIDLKDGRAKVSGKTNLPDQTSLLVTLESEATGYRAQNKTAVKDGRFSTKPFSDRSKELPASHYTISITAGISRTQPTEVQAVIGDEGQYLTGPLVEKSSFGGNVVSYSFSYTKGSEEEIEKVLFTHEQLILEIQSELDDLLKAGRSMDRYRNTEDRTLSRICREKMTANQAQAKTLNENAQALPSRYLGLKAATMEVNSCVSCSPSAMEACDRFEQSLNDL